MIRFSIPSVPIAQPRQRHALIAGHVRNFTPAKHPVQAFKAVARMAAHQAYQGPPLEGPLSLRVLFLMPRPGRLRWKKRLMPRQWHTSKPDADNLLKSLKDALSGLVYVDDAQICELTAKKVYCNGSEPPGLWVEIGEAGLVEGWGC